MNEFVESTFPTVPSNASVKLSIEQATINEDIYEQDVSPFSSTLGKLNAIIVSKEDRFSNQDSGSPVAINAASIKSATATTKGEKKSNSASLPPQHIQTISKSFQNKTVHDQSIVHLEF